MTVAGSAVHPVLERDRELASISAAVQHCRAGDGRFILIEGRVGAGKTRLLAEARALGVTSGLAVLNARGGELETGFAFGAVRQVFEPAIRAADDAVPDDLFAGAAAAARSLFGGVAPDWTAGVTDPSFAILHGLYWLTVELCARRPTMLVLDDLHWFDTPSLRWLAFLARRIEGVGVVVVAATRPDNEASDPALVAELLADQSVELLRPQPLGRASIATLLSARHRDQDDTFCAAVEEVTGGNPLFVRALLDEIEEKDIQATSAAAPQLRELAAEGVMRLVAARLARLSPPAVQLIRAAAVLGDEATVNLAAQLSGLAEQACGQAIIELTRSGLMNQNAPLVFAHPIVRTAVITSMSSVEGERAHRRAATLLADVGARPEQLSSHLLRVPPGDDPFVVQVLRQAGAQALQQGAADSAVTYLTRALEERVERPIALETLIELGQAERRTQGRAAVDHLGQALELLDEPKRRGELTLEYARALFFANRTAEAIASLEGALAGLSQGEDGDLSERLTAELVGAAWWQPDTHPIAATHLNKIDLDVLRGGLGTDLLLASLSTYECRQARQRDHAVALARRALTSGRLEDNAAGAFAYAASTLLFAGHFDEALGYFSHGLESARRRGDVVHVAALSLIWHGRALAFKGDLTAAALDLREAYELAHQHAVDVAVPYLIGFLADVLREQDDLHNAQVAIDAAGLAESLPQNTHLMFFRLARARLRLVAGDPQAALREAQEIGDTVRVVPSDNPAVIPWRAVAVEALRQLDRPEEARQLAIENLELAKRWGAEFAIGGAICSLARVDSKAAEELFREAVDVLATSNATLEYARAQVELGAWLRRANRRVEARQQLRQGVAVAEQLGARALLDRGNAEIAATGAKPRRQVITGLDALTASERRVAELAAQGASNRDIAQSLFVTVKTVELHLSNAYRKLDITSRSGLGRFFDGDLRLTGRSN